MENIDVPPLAPQLPATMRRGRLFGAGDLRLDDAPLPVPGPGETLVRMTDMGLCGSDLHWFSEGGIGDAVLTDPLVPGHELAGIAVDGPYAGRRVAIDPADGCGHCPLCEEGHRNLCPTVRFSGHGLTEGGLVEYKAWPTRLLHPLPEGMTGADGAMLEPLGVALHAWDLARPRLADPVVVVGCGPIGLLLVQLARTVATGAPVIAVEPLAHRREAALRCGASIAIDPADEAGLAQALALTGELGAPRVFEVAGNDDAVAIAGQLARPGAKVVLAGIPDHDTTTFPAGQARRKGLTFFMVRRMKEMYPRAIDLVSSGIIDVRSLVSHRIDLAQADEAFTRAVAREGLKVVVALGE